MPGRDRRIDALTGDYIKAAGGEYETTTTIEPAVYHQLKTERGRWCGDLSAGSDLYLVRTRGLNRGAVVFAQNAVRLALQPFVEQRLAKDLRVTAEGTETGRLVMETAITDVQGGVPITFTDIAPVGEG